ncbi:MAG: DegT/DnrJ/EryC1/StrS family aminotransferase [Lentisphaeria bacterium]|nr:DegT/DnrJ/EryC1/StrS family aminotransferase [Lentisphaeria bacterium]
MADRETLAVKGGAPAVDVPIPGRGHFGLEEKAAVDALFEEAVRTGNAPEYNGIQEGNFSLEFAERIGSRFADGVNSGSTAVFVALKALELPPFSEVVTSPITDAGGIMPVVLNSCVPVPADTVEGSYNIGPNEIEERITERTSAIVVAHIFGYPADMEGIMKVAEKHNLPVVEDCAQALGATIGGRHVGTFGTVGTFSLMSGKHICTGGQGGAVVTDDEELFWKLRRSADRGKPFHTGKSTNIFPSLNFNMDEIHAAIGRVQIKKLSSIVERRRKIMDILREEVFGKTRCMSCAMEDTMPGNACSSYWKTALKFHGENAKCTKAEFVEALKKEGLPVAESYRGAFQPEYEWYRNRANFLPWSSKEYKGDAGKSFAFPHAQKALEEIFLFFIAENFEGELLDKMKKAFLKADSFFAK